MDTKEVELRYEDLDEVHGVLEELGDLEIDDISLNVKIARIRTALQSEWKIFVQEQTKLVNRYVKEDSEEPVQQLPQGGALVDVQDGKEEEFNEKHQELMNQTVKLAIEPLTVSTMEGLSLRNDLVTTLWEHGILVEDS